jgi:hypothetical protein
MAGLTLYGIGALLSALSPGLGVLILGNSVLEGADHYNRHRPHLSLNLTPPDPSARTVGVANPATADVERRDRLGGLIHEYSLAA